MVTPRISVVMAVYNAELYLFDAINSILNQTFSDFEFIIINDNSNDNTESILLTFTDSRIRVYNNNINLGLTKSLNLGIGLSKAEFIARMDGDDIAEKDRFSSQIDFLVKNPDVVVCGTQVEYISDKSLPMGGSQFVCSPDEICDALTYTNVIAHPSVMFRKKLSNGEQIMYNEEFLKSQDYELWTRLVSQGFKIVNLGLIGLLHRKHSSQISNYASQEQSHYFVRANILFLSNLGFLKDKDEEFLFRNIYYPQIFTASNLITYLAFWDAKFSDKRNKLAAPFYSSVYKQLVKDGLIKENPLWWCLMQKYLIKHTFPRTFLDEFRFFLRSFTFGQYRRFNKRFL